MKPQYGKHFAADVDDVLERLADIDDSPTCKSLEISEIMICNGSALCVLRSPKNV